MLVDVIRPISGVKRGLVLVVVDDHPADDAVGSASKRRPCFRTGTRTGTGLLTLRRNHQAVDGGRRAVKKMRRGR